MMNGINDELILAARLLLATLFLIFGWRKLRDFPGTVNQMVQLGVPTPVLAAAVATLHGTSGGVRGRYRRIHASRRCTDVFLHAGNRAYRTSLLDSEGCGLSRQYGWLLQKSQHNGRLLAAVHYWCGKIFDR